MYSVLMTDFPSYQKPQEIEMVTPKTPTTEIPEIVIKSGEQFLSALKQYQQAAVEATQTWAKAVAVLPIADFPSVPGIPAVPNAKAFTTYAFDFTTELLNVQRDFALQLTSALAETSL
jgi:hypothetical protein